MSGVIFRHELMNVCYHLAHHSRAEPTHRPVGLGVFLNTHVRLYSGKHLSSHRLSRDTYCGSRIRTYDPQGMNLVS